jgi:hypothetical protein
MEGLAEHVEAGIKRAFYEELDKHLAETPGGCLIGQPNLTQTVEEDWLFETGPTLLFRMSAYVEDLPVPPEYRLIGGPADGWIVRTAGQRTWLVPVAPPPPTMTSYADPIGTVPRLVAEYERQGDTAAYFYRRTSQDGSW